MKWIKCRPLPVPGVPAAPRRDLRHIVIQNVQSGLAAITLIGQWSVLLCSVTLHDLQCFVAVVKVKADGFRCVCVCACVRVCVYACACVRV